jgi:DNA replication protein DnaC
MKSICDILPELFPSQPLKEDEYKNDADGLIYCARCHTPRQTRVLLGDSTMKPSVLCDCQRERIEKAEQRRKKREFFNQVSSLKANGLQDKALRDYTFSNDLGYNPEIEKAHRYVERWEDMKAASTGLLLWGGVGTGKSFFAGCIANALLEQGIPVLMTNFSRILNTLTGMYSEDKNRFIDSLNAYSLLILDDLGAERNSEFALEQVFSVIDSRYRSKKPLIITTNLTLDELKHPTDLAHARIYDRILERCVPLKINNRNIREQNAAAQLSRVREILTAPTDATKEYDF